MTPKKLNYILYRYNKICKQTRFTSVCKLIEKTLSEADEETRHYVKSVYFEHKKIVAVSMNSYTSCSTVSRNLKSFREKLFYNMVTEKKTRQFTKCCKII